MADPNASLNKVRQLDEAGFQKWLQERRAKWWGWDVNEKGEAVQENVFPSLEGFVQRATALFRTAKDDSKSLFARQHAADQLLRYDLKKVYLTLDEYKDFHNDARKSRRRRLESLFQPIGEPSSASSNSILPEDPVDGWVKINQAVGRFQDVRDPNGKEPDQSLDGSGRYNPYGSFLETATDEQITVLKQVKDEFCALYVDGTIAANEAIMCCYSEPEVTPTIDEIIRARSSHTDVSGLASEVGGTTIG